MSGWKTLSCFYPSLALWAEHEHYSLSDLGTVPLDGPTDPVLDRSLRVRRRGLSPTQHKTLDQEIQVTMQRRTFLKMFAAFAAVAVPGLQTLPAPSYEQIQDGDVEPLLPKPITDPRLVVLLSVSADKPCMVRVLGDQDREVAFCYVAMGNMVHNLDLLLLGHYLPEVSYGEKLRLVASDGGEAIAVLKSISTKQEDGTYGIRTIDSLVDAMSRQVIFNEILTT